MHVLFYHVKTKTNRKGLAPIFCRITINGQRKQFSTRIYVGFDHWSGSEVINHPLGDDYNSQINHIRAKLSKAYTKLYLSNEPTHVRKVLDLYHHKGQLTDRTLKSISIEYLDYCRHKVEKNKIKPETVRQYRHRSNQLDRFLSIKGMTAIQLNHFGVKEIGMYREYLLENLKLSHNYAMKCALYVKQLYHYATAKGYLDHNSIKNFTLNYERKQELNSLSPDEVTKIESVFFWNKKYNRYRDLFLFQIYSGMAYSDTQLFDQSMIRKGLDDRPYIFYNRQKTKEKAIVPITSKLKNLLEKINYQTPKTSLENYNRNLKVIAEKTDLNKKVTSHTGRITCGMIYLNDGISLAAVSKILGHSNPQTTHDCYAKVNELLIRKDFKKVYGV